MAITGFVLSFFCGVLGLIFSLLGLSECKKSEGQVGGAGLAIAGIIISIVTLVVAILWWVLIFRTVSEVQDFVQEAEVRLELNQMSRAAKTYYSENGGFPKMSAPLTPPTSCCDEALNTCDGEWSHAAWREIGFSLYGSTHWRYSYTSNESKFEAMAIGDLDCDGHEVTYRLTVEAPGGSFRSEIDEPADAD